MNISEFKKHFASDPRFTNLNNAGMASIPDVYRDEAIHWLNRFYNEGSLAAMAGWERTDSVRKKFAQLMGAHPEEVAFLQTTASALSQAAFSIPLEAGDEILTWDQEYPSNFYPWREVAAKNSARLIQVESENWQTPARKILDRVTLKTKIIAVSWVQYQTGSITDLKEISTALKGKGIWLVADVIQGAGVQPFDFHQSGFDIVCGGSHKWLCSGFGVGFMLVTQERLSQMAPREVGAMTYGTPDTEKSFSIQPKNAAIKFEPGTKALIEVLAMEKCLDLFLTVGMPAIYQEASRLADLLRAGLRDLGFQIHSPTGPFVTFSPNQSGELNEIMEKLTKAGIGFAKRGPGIRLSVHAYNRDEEIARVRQVLK